MKTIELQIANFATMVLPQVWPQEEYFENWLSSDCCSTHPDSQPDNQDKSMDNSWLSQQPTYKQPIVCYTANLANTTHDPYWTLQEIALESELQSQPDNQDKHTDNIWVSQLPTYIQTIVCYTANWAKYHT